MCGAEISVLGVKPECIIRRLTTHHPVKFEVAEGKTVLCGVLIEIDPATGKAVSIKRIKEWPAFLWKRKAGTVLFFEKKSRQKKLQLSGSLCGVLIKPSPVGDLRVHAVLLQASHTRKSNPSRRRLQVCFAHSQIPLHKGAFLSTLFSSFFSHAKRYIKAKKLLKKSIKYDII